MTSKRLLLAAIALGVACGDPVAPDPTPPLLAVAKIVYTADAALVFTSNVVPVRALVKAYDKDGNELPSTRLQLTLPSGWTLRNDSIVAPTLEGNWRLKATAKSAASLDETEVTDTSLVTAALDLNDYNWTATYKCTQAPTQYDIRAGENNALVDSVLVAAAIDSTIYGVGTAGVYFNYGGVASMWWHGTSHFYLRDGTDFIADVSDRMPVRRQAPDSIVFDPSAGGANQKAIVTRQGESDQYAGGSWCSTAWISYAGDGRGPVTLTRTPKVP